MCTKMLVRFVKDRIRIVRRREQRLKGRSKKCLRLSLYVTRFHPVCPTCYWSVKKNGEQRFCIDNRGLNKCIIPEIHSVPLWSIIHDTLSYAKPVIFSTLDLRTSLHSLVVEEESIKYTAFQSHLGQFKFCRAKFGIRTCLSHLIRAVCLNLVEKEGPLMQSALANVDDVMCYSGTLLLFHPSYIGMKYLMIQTQ